MITRAAFAVAVAALIGAQFGCMYDDRPVHKHTVTNSFDHLPDDALAVETRNGAIRVFQADPAPQPAEATGDGDPAPVEVTPQVTIEAEFFSKDEERIYEAILVVERSTGALEVSTRWPDGRRRYEGTNYRISAPGFSAVRLESGNGALELDGFALQHAHLRSGNGAVNVEDVQITSAEGKVIIDTGNGAVSVERVAGDVDLESGNGAVWGERIDGALIADTGNGAIVLEHVTGPITLDSGNGQIKVTEVQGSVRAESGNGAVTITLADDNPGPVYAKSGNGRVAFIYGDGFKGLVKAYRGGRLVETHGDADEASKDHGAELRTSRNSSIEIRERSDR